MELTCSLTLARSGARVVSTSGSVISSSSAIFTFLCAFLVPHRLKFSRPTVVATLLTGGFAKRTSLDKLQIANLLAIWCKACLRSCIRRKSECTVHLYEYHAAPLKLGYSGHSKICSNSYATEVRIFLHIEIQIDRIFIGTMYDVADVKKK